MSVGITEVLESEPESESVAVGVAVGETSSGRGIGGEKSGGVD